MLNRDVENRKGKTLGKKLIVHQRDLKLNKCKIYAKKTKIYVNGIEQEVKDRGIEGKTS